MIMDRIGTNGVMKGEPVMATVNESSRIEAHIEAINDYLKKEFEQCSIVHHTDRPLTYTFIVENGKKLFKLTIGWPILADRR